MLSLINEERRKAGVGPIALGDNPAPQIHAENALRGCFRGHWGADGTKPYMRYSLAGGAQRNGENGLGLAYCLDKGARVSGSGPIETRIENAMRLWMVSQGHQRNILDPSHHKVNIGLAWDRHNVRFYQHFEAGYLSYQSLPAIENGFLHVEGELDHGAQVNRNEDMDIHVYYDPPPTPLTRGQLAKTYDLRPGPPGCLHPVAAWFLGVAEEFLQNHAPAPFCGPVRRPRRHRSAGVPALRVVAPGRVVSPARTQDHGPLDHGLPVAHSRKEVRRHRRYLLRSPGAWPGSLLGDGLGSCRREDRAGVPLFHFLRNRAARWIQ